MAPPEVRFYYGLGSRYSYLASTQIARLEADTGCRVRWRPLYSGDLFRARGADPFQGPPVSGQYDWAYRRFDAECWADYYGVPYREPADVRCDPRRLALAATAAARLGAVEAFSRRLFQALFVDGRSPLDDDACVRIANGIGLDPSTFAAALDDPETAGRARGDRRGGHGGGRVRRAELRRRRPGLLRQRSPADPAPHAAQDQTSGRAALIEHRDQDLCIGLDVGTSGVKAILVAADGAVVASAGAEYPLLTPRPGWTEQEPEDWWRASCAALRRLRAAAPGPIAALGLTGQMHGAVFLAADGQVIRPAILWNDQRTAAECAEIERRVGAERLRAIAGNPALTGFQAPKALWLRRHEPEAYARVRHLLLPKDFVRFRLTGDFASDASDAAGTLLLDLAARDWSAELLGALEIPRDWLPRVHEGPEVTGRVSAAGAAASGLPEGLPVVAGGGDNAAAAVGCGVVRPGTGLVSLGTSGVVFVASAGLEIDPGGALHAFCHAVPGRYHLMGVVLSAGGSLRWYREAIGAPPAEGGGDPYDALMTAAAAVAPGAEGLFFLPYLAGERTPHMDPQRARRPGSGSRSPTIGATWCALCSRA